MCLSPNRWARVILLAPFKFLLHPKYFKKFLIYPFLLLLHSFLFSFLLTPFTYVFLLAELLLPHCGWFRRGALSRWLVTCYIEFVVVVVVGVAMQRRRRLVFYICERSDHTDWQSIWSIQIANPYGFNAVKKQTNTGDRVLTATAGGEMGKKICCNEPRIKQS